jgi:hypothetical protein
MQRGLPVKNWSGLQNHVAGSKLVYSGALPDRAANTKQLYNQRRFLLAKFQRENFIRIIQEIEAMEASGENI